MLQIDDGIHFFASHVSTHHVDSDDPVILSNFARSYAHRCFDQTILGQHICKIQSSKLFYTH